MTDELEAGVRRVLKSVLLEVAREVLPEIRNVVRYSPAKEAVDAPTLLRPRDAAAALCISERHLYTLTKEGIIPCVRLNRLVRYSTDGIRAWISETEGKYCGDGYHLPRPAARISASEGKTSQKRRRTHPLKKQAVKTVRKPGKERVEQSSILHEEPSDFDKLLHRVGVSPENLPPITYPELAKVGGITANQLHSFFCSHADLPESAVTRYREYFSAPHAERDKGVRPAMQVLPAESDTRQCPDYKPREIDDILTHLGLTRELLPPIRFEDIVKVTGLDPDRLRAWVYHHQDLPFEAIAKLEQHFLKAAMATPDDANRGSESSIEPSANPRPTSLRKIAQRIGIEPERIPRLTNGELMKIAGVDTATLHGWQYLGRDLTSSAIAKIEEYLTRNAIQT